jgi:hypothetical protein
MDSSQLDYLQRMLDTDGERMERMFEIQMKKADAERQKKLSLEQASKQQTKSDKLKDTSFGMVKDEDGNVRITIRDTVVSVEEARRLIGNEDFEMALRFMS